MAEQEQTLFRQKALDRVSSPEQLTDYLRVTDPGIWVILAAVILLLAGLLVWSTVGTIETTTGAKVVVKGHKAEVILSELPQDSDLKKQADLIVRVDGKDYPITSVEADEYGRIICLAEVDLSDGTYDGLVVLSRTKPISFLLTSQ